MPCILVDLCVASLALTPCVSHGGAGCGIHHKSEVDALKPGWGERWALSRRAKVVLLLSQILPVW